MTAMENYKNILITGVKLEKMDMKSNAQKLYREFVVLVSRYDNLDVLNYFYKIYDTSGLIVNSYVEALSLAHLIEKLRILYDLISKYKSSWNDRSNSSNQNDQTLMNFFDWLCKSKLISQSDQKYIIRNSSDDLKIVEKTINILKDNTSFGINFNESYGLMEVVFGIINDQIKVDINRNELR